jgi:hypothetical protein
MHSIIVITFYRLLEQVEVNVVLLNPGRLRIVIMSGGSGAFNSIYLALDEERYEDAVQICKQKELVCSRAYS